MEKQKLRSYWTANLRYLVILVLLWFVFGLLCPILLADQLNAFYLGGLPLGFWFATQGSLVIMVLLLFIYAGLMNALDKKYDLDED